MPLRVLRLRALLSCEDGQSLVEYSLLIALISIAGIAALTILGKKLHNTLSSAALGLS